MPTRQTTKHRINTQPNLTEHRFPHDDLVRMLHTWAVTNQASLWICIALYAGSKADEHGVAYLDRGELRAALDPYRAPRTYRHGIQRAIDAGWFTKDSTSREIRLVK